jgi:hypothetical protein
MQEQVLVLVMAQVLVPVMAQVLVPVMAQVLVKELVREPRLLLVVQGHLRR